MLQANAKRKHGDQRRDADRDAERGQRISQQRLAQIAQGELGEIGNLHGRAPLPHDSCPDSADTVRFVADQLAIRQKDHALRIALGQSAFVRHHHDRHSQLLVEFADHIHDFGSGVAVEISGGFVGQQKLRTVDQSAGQRGPLLFAAGKLAGPMIHARLQADALQRLARQSVALAALDFGKAQRQFHVFRERHAGNQIERLKNHAHGVQPVFGQIFARKLRQIAFLHR